MPNIQSNETAGAVAAALELLKRIREAVKKDAAAHCEKFSAATFEADRRSVRRPKAPPTVLRPLVDKMVAVALEKLYKEKFGKEIKQA